jgi:hypothetical protein
VAAFLFWPVRAAAAAAAAAAADVPEGVGVERWEALPAMGRVILFEEAVL